VRVFVVCMEWHIKEVVEADLNSERESWLFTRLRSLLGSKVGRNFVPGKSERGWQILPPVTLLLRVASSLGHRADAEPSTALATRVATGDHGRIPCSKLTTRSRKGA